MKKSFIQRLLMPLLALVVVAAAGVLIWNQYQKPELPVGFASGNGRIEATEYDIASKRAGRVTDVLVKEGDMVDVGQVLARIDTRDLEAELREAEARLSEAKEGKNYAGAIVEQRESELTYAKIELERLLELVEKGHVSQEKVDQARTARQSSEAALRAARILVIKSEASVKAAIAHIERLVADIEDCVLKTPVRGRVLYRLAEPGEILPAGGKVLTVLELTDVYMTIYLPSRQVGKVVIGSEARIKLDSPETIWLIETR